MNGLVAILNKNPILALSILSWIAAQIFKVAVKGITERTLDLSVLLSSGGMPSSHSALVCACATTAGMFHGWSSGLFAVSAVIAAVVMYDAANVRHAAGEQAKLLNYIMENWNQIRPEFYVRELKELLGHTPVQVFFGGLLGAVVGVWGYYFLR